MRFANSSHPTEKELREWSAEAGAAWPEQDWEATLARGIDRNRLRMFSELAADASLPNARFFLLVLYVWVELAASDEALTAWHPQFERWLDETKGIDDPGVKRWRHQARRVLQCVEPFDARWWWAEFASGETAEEGERR